MTATASAQVVGANEAIRSLRKIDPDIRKQFNRDIKQILQPVIQDAQAAYPAQVLSGMERKWQQRGTDKFPYNQAKAKRGVRPKIDTSRKTTAVIKVQQVDPAAAIVEVAGRKTGNPLGRSLDRVIGKASRIMWPAAERNLPKVTREVESAVLAAVRQVQKEL